MNTVLGVIIGILVMTILVVIHEFGHFIAARKNGVKVNEFGIGFPPRAVAWLHVETDEIKKNGKKKWKWVRIDKKDWQKKQKTLIFSINWLPIGGFCSMDGESDADTRKGTFGAASFWSKTKILFAGVTLNWLFAWILFTILAFTGMPLAIENQFFFENDHYVEGQPITISEVIKDTPANAAGFQAEDKIVSACILDGDQCQAGTTTNFYDTSLLISFDSKHAGENIRYFVLRDDSELTLDVKLAAPDAKYTLGVAMRSESASLHRATWSAPLIGATTTIQLTGETYRGLWNMLTGLIGGAFSQFSPDSETREAGKAEIGAAGDSVTGPIGIIGVIFPNIVAGGPTYIIYIAAIISISLACMNVLPIPALDGGRWLLIAIYRLRRKPLTEEVEGKIVSRAFIVLIGLIILITALDIFKLFR